ncbi:hypothetical protein ACQP2U_43220 (plasmid) [Nocardia sp. CA-084685]|uniref:hypothetical protein n=1 Tax=Nocardia sp. CA-084685 TaxID=3239970 RepID=UPI003D996787
MHAIVRPTAAALLSMALAAGCGSGGDQRVEPKPVDLTAAPAALTWENYRGVRLPRSAVDGPTQFGQIANGYTQTPQGAVLAAIRGQAALILAGDNEWGTVVATLTAPGPGRDEFAANRAVLSVSGSVPAGQAPRFVGFKVITYQPDPPIAGVRVVEQIGSPPRTFAYPVALQWIGDWRIVLPTVAEGIDAIELDNLDGYTRLEDK